MAKKNGAEIMMEYFIKEKVPYVVGVPGHTLMPFLDAMYMHQDKIKSIFCRHEHVAVCLADGYFRATGKPLPVYLHIGPGLANGLNGVAVAALDSVAMIVITGNTWQKHMGRNTSQETSKFMDAEQASFLRPLVKRSYVVQRADNLPEILHKAFRTAVSGRPGPVHIDISLTVQAEEVDVEEMPDLDFFKVPSKIRPEAEQVNRAVKLLMGAKRPVIIGGSGARVSGASCAILELAERLAAPVASAHRGKGVIPEDHPLALGLCGAEARPYTNPIIADADVILAVGMRFTEPDTTSWTPGAPFNIPPSRLIHIDIDPDEIARYFPTEVGIWSDAKTAMEEIVAGVTRAQNGNKPNPYQVERIKQLQEKRAEWKKSVAEYENSDAVPIRPERMIKELRQAIPRDAFVLMDTGKAKNWVYRYFEVYTPDTFDIGIGWTTMGHSPAAALGVKLGNPKRPVVALVGDGSFQMTPYALSTAVDYGIPVVIVIFNDYALGATRDCQKREYENRFINVEFKIDGGELFNPDFVKLAEAYGALGERVEKPGDLGPAMKRALASGRPYVLDVVPDRDVQFTFGAKRPFRHLPKH